MRTSKNDASDGNRSSDGLVVDNLKLREALAQAIVDLARISKWRVEARAADEDMGHGLRAFDDEDWDRIEGYACECMKRAGKVLSSC